MEINHKNTVNLSPTPSSVLSIPVSSEGAVEEIPHHTITIPEPHVCRICDDDEDENGEGLVELGCKCKGEMSKMHKTCFLQWFGIRTLLRDNNDCEICNSMLAFETQKLVAEAVADHVNGGRKILMRGLQSELGQRGFFSAQRAANFDELVQVLMEVNAPMLPRNPRLPRRPMFPRRGQEFAIDVGMEGEVDEAEGHPLRTTCYTIGVIVVAFIGAMAYAGFLALFLRQDNIKFILIVSILELMGTYIGSAVA